MASWELTTMESTRNYEQILSIESILNEVVTIQCVKYILIHFQQQLKDFKENISEFKKVDLDKLDEMAEEIYKGYIEFEIEPLETNSLDELF